MRDYIMGAFEGALIVVVVIALSYLCGYEKITAPVSGLLSRGICWRETALALPFIVFYAGILATTESLPMPGMECKGLETSFVSIPCIVIGGFGLFYSLA